MLWTKTWKKQKTITSTVPLKVILKSYQGADVSVYLCGSLGNYIILLNNLRPEGLDLGTVQTTNHPAGVEESHRKEYTATVLASQFFCLVKFTSNSTTEDPVLSITTSILQRSFFCAQFAVDNQTALSKSVGGLDSTFVLPFCESISLHTEVCKEPQCYKVQSYRGSQV